MSKINKITPLTNVKFLNLYELEAENKFGDTHPYYVASRKNENMMMAATKEVIPDGVVIYSLFGEKADHLIMVRQFRYPLNDYIYEFPAGLIDNGEDVIKAATRELFEETGLLASESEYLIKPSYTSVGMSDESVAVVKMKVYGNISTENLEENEEIEVIKVPRKEAKNFVKENNVSIKTALVLSFM